jgi:hypothetical protein
MPPKQRWWTQRDTPRVDQTFAFGSDVRGRIPIVHGINDTEALVLAGQLAGVLAIVQIDPGIGFNLPGGGPDDPEAIYQCVRRAFDAGAGGIVVSREYEELTVPNLKAVGRAVRELRQKSAAVP